MKFSTLAALTLLSPVAAKCPFAGSSTASFRDSPHHPDQHPERPYTTDVAAVKRDLLARMTTSDPSWPADYGTYGPFFIRLAWHCSGSYRLSDGLGGCDGGRQRFDPERSWEDNTNLDKARSLLGGIKDKYGDSLSWGDLFILAGDTAIESMGGPVLGFCGGRVDDSDGSASLPLGPTPEQELLVPCLVPGDCKSPLGSTTIGLIYVNPEGPQGVPDPAQSAPQVRDTFGRMGMDDGETVALIGGGHAFGKAHGACPAGAGPGPKDDEENPWPGNCGSGVGMDTFTSGFEGSWSSTPTVWSNDYFKKLLNLDWRKEVGPGGHWQWFAPNSTAPAADGSGDVPTLMLTSDVSLLTDPSYRSFVELYASDIDALNSAFSSAWYKLTSRDMGPATRCRGDTVPPPQPFQNPLPPPLLAEPPVSSLSRHVDDLLDSDPKFPSLLLKLTWSCANTFRPSDYLGGCNGARIRLPPATTWPEYAGLDEAVEALEKVRDLVEADGGEVSLADVIVFAGTKAFSRANKSVDISKFCFGRTDAKEGDQGWQFLQPTTRNVAELFEEEEEDAAKVWNKLINNDMFGVCIKGEKKE